MRHKKIDYLSFEKISEKELSIVNGGFIFLAIAIGYLISKSGKNDDENDGGKFGGGGASGSW